MKKLTNKKQLIAFENEIASLFNKTDFDPAPRTEDFLIKFFKKIKKKIVVNNSGIDYHCLLKGVPTSKN